MQLDSIFPDGVDSMVMVGYEPGEGKALKSLVTAAFVLDRAFLLKDSSLFQEAFYLAEEAVEVFTDLAAGHYVLGMAKLKGWGDRDYASKKYKLLLTLETEFARDLGQNLKDELEAAES